MTLSCLYIPIISVQSVKPKWVRRKGLFNFQIQAVQSDSQLIAQACLGKCHMPWSRRDLAQKIEAQRTQIQYQSISREENFAAFVLAKVDGSQELSIISNLAGCPLRIKQLLRKDSAGIHRRRIISPMV